MEFDGKTYDKDYLLDLCTLDKFNEMHNDKNKKSNKQVSYIKENKFNLLIDCIIYNKLKNVSKFTIDKEKVMICSKLYENLENYENFNFKKSFTKKKIEKGLMDSTKNNISSILYIINLYNINVILYDNNDYYKLSSLNKSDTNQYYTFNNGWYLSDMNIDDSIIFKKLDKKSNLFNFDISDLNIKNGLSYSISNYKLKDLQELCNKVDINIKLNNGKLKKKTILYDELNNYYYIKNK